MTTIPEPFLCHHKGTYDDGKSVVVEVYEEGKSYPTYYHCLVCGDRFPTIGDTDKWEPVMVDYDIPS